MTGLNCSSCSVQRVPRAMAHQLQHNIAQQQSRSPGLNITGAGCSGQAIVRQLGQGRLRLNWTGDWGLGRPLIMNYISNEMCPQLMHSTHFSPSSLHLSAGSELVVAASFI